MPFQSRRQFFTTSALAAGAIAGTTTASQAAANNDGRQYYEWRTYHLVDARQQSRVLKHLESAAVPAWERYGLGPIGVFTETGDKATENVHVILTGASTEHLIGERVTLEADSAYLDAADGYLSTDKGDPAFARIESTLLLAFEGQPQLKTPRRRPRVLEMRTYESHSEAKARRKIDMFNDGEIPIFVSAGFETVFFGESMIGPGLPNLKYMLASDDLEANRASWQAFINHSDWKAMKDLPKYADTVSRIHNVFLVPTSFSEV